MDKQALINEIANRTSLDQGAVSKVVDHTFALIERHASRGKRVVFPGFGHFRLWTSRDGKSSLRFVPIDRLTEDEKSPNSEVA